MNHPDDEFALERWRHAPSPPCAPSGSAEAPGRPVDFAPLNVAERRRLLAAAAEAIDTLHGFRLAHGRLDLDSLRWDGAHMWIVGVQPRWHATGGGASPRQADLEYFAALVESALGPRNRPADGATAKAVLAAWNEIAPPSAPSEESTFEPDFEEEPQEEVFEDVARQPGRRRPPKLAIGAAIVMIVVIVGCAVGFAAWQGWFGNPRPAEGRRRSVTKEGGGRRGKGGADALLPTIVGMHNRRALAELLCSSEPDADERFAEHLDRNDPTLHGVIATLIEPGDSWAPLAAPRLRAFVGKPKQESALRAVERAFLCAARSEDLAVVRGLLNSQRAETRADACWALARLGTPPPAREVAEAAANASPEAADAFVEYALAHASPGEFDAFLAGRLFDGPTTPREALFKLSRKQTPSGSDAAGRFDRNLTRLLSDAVARLAVVDGPRADADLLAALHALWRLHPKSPTDLLHSLELPPERAALVRRRASRMLLAPPSPSAPQPLEWEAPDPWYSTAAAWAGEPPSVFANALLAGQTLGLPASARQARLLALADSPNSPAMDRLLVEVGGALHSRYAGWKHTNPELLSGAVALLAASESQAVEPMLRNFFAGETIAREPAAWDGLLAGAAANPKLRRDLLERATAHPLSTIRLPAQSLLALANCDPRGWRSQAKGSFPLDDRLAELAAKLEKCFGEIDAQETLSRERDSTLAATALALSRSDGVRELLLVRVGRGEAPYATFTAMANAPRPFEPRRFDEFLRREPPFQLIEQAVMRGVEAHGGSPLESIVEWTALHSLESRNPPPLGHRVVALGVFGSLKRTRGERATVRTLLRLAETDASKLVRRSAAAAALRVVAFEQREELRNFVASRPSLDPVVVEILRLAEKL